MTDLASLYPTDDTPAALAAAICRCGIAGRGALAEIDRLKATRAGLLLAGHPSQLEHNLSELVAAMGHATRISELLDQLQAKAANPDPVTITDPRVTAIAAVAEVSAWWKQHGPTVIAGAELAVAAIAAVATVAKAATPQAPMPPGANVTPLRPQPAA